MRFITLEKKQIKFYASSALLHAKLFLALKAQGTLAISLAYPKTVLLNLCMLIGFCTWYSNLLLFRNCTIWTIFCSRSYHCYWYRKSIAQSSNHKFQVKYFKISTASQYNSMHTWFSKSGYGKSSIAQVVYSFARGFAKFDKSSSIPSITVTIHSRCW